jgi:hypothetical protein
MSSITKPSQKAREFIQAAPDAKPAAAKGRKTSQQITLILGADMLARLDEMAQQTDQTRSGLIKTGIVRLLRDGL